MENALIIGGTRYFGKRLVQLLLDQGVPITLISRGFAPNPFGTKVEHLKVDRNDPKAFAQALRHRHFSVVYDQVCYWPSEASRAIAVLQGNVEHYIMTSTQSVYEGRERENTKEELFDPSSYPIQPEDRASFSYGEAKRQAEAVFYQHSSLPLTSVRLSAVLGLEDWSGRLEFYIDHIKAREPISITGLDIKNSFISEEEAAAFLVWWGRVGPLGPVNACSDGVLELGALIEWIEASTNRKAVIKVDPRGENLAPFSRPCSFSMNTEKARSHGFLFKELNQWLPALIESMSTHSRQKNKSEGERNSFPKDTRVGRPW